MCKRTYIAFVDIVKALDNVNWKVLFNNVHQTGTIFRNRRLIFSQETVVQCGIKESLACIQNVRQEYSLFPYFFNLYVQNAVDRVREVNLEVTMHGEKIVMLIFADNIGLMEESEDLPTY